MGFALFLASKCRRPSSRHMWRVRFQVCKPRLQKRLLFGGDDAGAAPLEDNEEEEVVDSSSLLESSSASSHQSDSLRGLSRKFSVAVERRRYHGGLT